MKKNRQDSLRFELGKDEQWVDEFHRSSFRTEVDTKEYAPMRSVRWYSLSLRLPTDFPKERNWLVLEPDLVGQRAVGPDEGART